MKKGEINELQEELDFLGLNLSRIPKFIKDATVPTFNISRINNDKDLKVYKYVPVDQIEILLSPTLRSDSIKKKYGEAIPLKSFLNNDGDEEEIMLYKTFAKILRNMSTAEIDKIEQMQEIFAEEQPFKVKYNKDHLWQIYYSETDNKYFMIVCTKEDMFSEFLYLLKKQLEFSKSRKKEAPQIYVPINYVNYSEGILQKNEISDLENYLWLFTKNWPLIFEVYNENNELSLQIVGETFVYKNIKSYYKVVLNSTEEAIKFYKLLKALFILQTEIKGQYNFETKVNTNDELSMYLSKVEITFDSLTNFIKNEFLLADYEIKEQNKNTIELEKKLSELKQDVKKKEDEYLQKQKQISTYLECKKTFLGKVKYFFKSEKGDKSKKNNQEYDNILETENNIVDTKPINTYIEDKNFYTIEDLVTIYSLHEKGQKYYKNLSQDIKALELKLENIISKVNNANLYIEEIDKHKKSIFEFWKFANKDEKLALEMADSSEQEKEKKEIKKSFNFEMDFEKLGEEADKLQRKKLSNEELDSIFIANTELLDLLNEVRSNNVSKEDLEDVLANLKQEFNNSRLVIEGETFDIFGNITEANNKVKYIGSRSHRELEKDKYKIMNINKDIDVFDFTEKIQSTLSYLEGAIPKITSKYDISLYKVKPIAKNLEEDNLEIFNIDVENELEEFEGEENVAYNLICLNYKEDLPILYYTNATFFDNTNKTLPIGMNLSTNVLIDNKRLEFLLVNKTKFRTNSYFKNSEEYGKIKSKDIFVYEYDVSLKEVKNDLIPEKSVIVTDEIIEKNIESEIKMNENIESELIEEDDIFVNDKDIFGDLLEEDDVVDDVNDNITEDVQNLEAELESFDEKYEDYYEEIEKHVQKNQILKSNEEEVPIVKKSKKLLKIEQKYEKEMQKQQEKEEKARKKLEKKNKSKKEGKK